MTHSKAERWRTWWYVLGSILTGAGLLFLAHGPSVNRVDIAWNKWRISQVRTEKPQKEGRILIRTERHLGPLTITSLSWDSVSNRAASAKGQPQ